MTDSFLIFANEHFVIEQSRDHLIPGYLILRPVQVADSIVGMTKQAIRQLGPLMALSYACIEKVVNPEIIYCARFGEKVRAIHFHLFPRSRYMGDVFKKAHDLTEQADISGPQLLDWLMKRKPPSLDDPKNVATTIALLKKEFLAMKDIYL